MQYDGFGWHRESSTVAWRDARAPLREAALAWAAARGVALAEDAEALQTRSVRRPGLLDRWFGRDTTSWSVAVLAPGLVLWTVQGPGAAPVTLAAPLASVGVERGMGGRIGASIAGARALRGLSFTATFVGATEGATAFLGFGPEADGDAFERRLRAAAAAAGNPAAGAPA